MSKQKTQTYEAILQGLRAEDREALERALEIAPRVIAGMGVSPYHDGRDVFGDGVEHVMGKDDAYLADVYLQQLNAAGRVAITGTNDRRKSRSVRWRARTAITASSPDTGSVSPLV
jgi:hypothetical protein